MIEVVGVRFKEIGKIYYFSPNGFDLHLKDPVIVETSRGIEYGNIAIKNRKIPEDHLNSELKPIIRIADELDKKIYEDNKLRARDAIEICLQKILEHELDMKLVDCEYTYDGQKLIFYFISDGRVDFRNLVKDLAQIFRTRIELRQVGIRDKAKTIPSYGICGQQTCCTKHLTEFQPVSIKMAKDQDLSLNPTKISGVCGRLMCCLKYEEEVYECNCKLLFPVGTRVMTNDGEGVVEQRKILDQKLVIKVNLGDVEELRTYKFDEVKKIN